MDRLFDFFDDAMVVGFTSDSMCVGDERLEKETLYTDIARMFHFRKIKILEIKPSVTSKELGTFLSKACLPKKDIFEGGGLKKMLEKETLLNIKIQELDYSQLLKGEGEEIKDIWTYLLKEAVQEKNEQKMDYLAENSERISNQIHAEEILEDEGLSHSFQNFFSYLSENKKEKYISFSKRLMRSALHSKEISSKEKLDNLKPLLTDLSEKDLASTLWDEILTNQDFDEVNFSIFSKLIEKEKHEQIAESLLEVFKSSSSETKDSLVKENIRELLSGTSSPLISEIYRNSLQSMLKNISEKSEKLCFNSSLLQKNFHLMLLNILDIEKDPESLSPIAKTLLDEWENIIESEDMSYLKYLYETMEAKKETLSSIQEMRKLESMLNEYIEESILDGKLSLQFNYFIEHITKSTQNENVYLETIFTQEIITPYILKSFFRFFTEYLFYFNLNLEQRAGDEVFLKKIIESLSFIDSPISLITLKKLFKLGTKNIKIKTLKAMQNLEEQDDQFLFPLIKKKQYDLKKQAFILLSRSESSQHRALQMLFSIKSPFGLRNKRLHQHIQIMDEQGVRSSKKHLIDLSEKKFIWNQNLRNHALNVLRKWNDRKS
ncbi:MAG: hypothetical protein GF421_08205 [Candidatus Aminicenantes bacterium]|nr:hypothetical protein [Candidatus Aminicenantes bacterium]